MGIMSTIGPPGIEAGGSIISSIIGAHSARQQMDFQREMSNTAHQREVGDLVKAGLNPMLSAMGSGATTPPGTSFTPDNPARGVAQSIMQQRLGNAELGIKSETVKNIAADTAKKKAEASVASSQEMRNLYGIFEANKKIDEMTAQIENLNQSTRHSAQDVRRMQAELPKKEALGSIWSSRFVKGFIDFWTNIFDPEKIPKNNGEIAPWRK